MTCEEIRKRLDGYLDREVDAEVRREIEAHLVECLECARVADERRAFSDRIATAIRVGFGELQPGPAQRSRVVDALVRRSRPRGKWLPVLAAAAAFLLVGGIIVQSLGVFEDAAPEPTELERIAAMAAERDFRTVQVEKMIRELEAMIEKMGGEPKTGVAAASAALELAMLEDLLAQAAGASGAIDAASPAEQAEIILAKLQSKDYKDRYIARKYIRQMDAKGIEALGKYTKNAQGHAQQILRIATNQFEDVPVAFAVKLHPIQTVTREKEGVVFRMEQYPDARVKVFIEGGEKETQLEASDIIELTVSYPEICREYDIVDQNGTCLVGLPLKAGNRVARDIAVAWQRWNPEQKGVLDVMDNVQGDALLLFSAANAQDPGAWTATVSHQVNAARQREWDKILDQRRLYRQQKDLDKQVRRLQKELSRLNRKQVREESEKLELELKELEAKLGDLEGLRVRCQSWQSFVSGLGKIAAEKTVKIRKPYKKEEGHEKEKKEDR